MKKAVMLLMLTVILVGEAAAQGETRHAQSEMPFLYWRTKGIGYTVSFLCSFDSTYGEAVLPQIGLAYSRMITKNLSLVVEANLGFGTYNIEKSDFSSWSSVEEKEANANKAFYGISVPIICQLDLRHLSLEGGVQFDRLSDVDSYSVYNFGLVAGVGFTFGRHRMLKYFYRVNIGTAYTSFMFGWQKLF